MYNFSHIKVELIPHPMAGSLPDALTLEVRATYRGEEFVSREIMLIDDLESGFSTYLDRVKEHMTGYIKRHFEQLRQSTQKKGEVSNAVESAKVS